MIIAKKKKPIVTAKEASERALKAFNVERDRDWGLMGCDTGHHMLNLAIDGFQPGKVIVLGGRSGAGKSAFTIPMVRAGINQKSDRRSEMLIFSWELSEVDYTKRIVSNLAGVSNRFLGQAAKLLESSEANHVTKAYRDAESLPVTYQLMSLDENKVAAVIEEWMEYVEEKQKTVDYEIYPLVIIDYIGLAVFEGQGLRTHAMGSFMLKMKQMANNMGITFVILGQINRAVDKEKRPPTAADFQDSASLEQTADCLLAVHRPELLGDDVIEDPMTGEMIDSSGKTLLRILKNRAGTTGDFIINHDLRYYRYWNPDHTWDYDYNQLYSKEEFWRQVYGL